MSLAETILVELEQESHTTRRVLDRVPEAKLSWKPHPKSFSLGQLALHIASTQGQVAALAARDVVEDPVFGQPEPANRREIFEAFSKSVEQAKSAIGKMDDARLKSIWTLTKNGQTIMAVPRADLLRSVLLNHVYHHRGQLSVYLRLLDVPVPSIYGPSADENPFN
jgi:uncharacterized damage-inducible protein DinB